MNKAPGEMSKNDKEQEEADDALLLGMKLGTLDEAAYALYNIVPEIEGVVISFVEVNSAADNKRVKAGNVIVEINQERVTTPDQARERIQDLRNSGRKNALLLLAEPSGELRFITLLFD